MKENQLKKEIFIYSIPVILNFLINLFFIGINCSFWLPIINPRGYITEIIIIYSIFVFIIGISGKVKTSITILGIFNLIISVFSQIKISFTYEPLFLSDLLFFVNFGEILQIVQSELIGKIKTFIVPLIIEIISFIIIIKIGRNLSKDIIIKNIKYRIIIILSSLIFLILLFAPIQSINKIIINKCYNRIDYAGIATMFDYYLNYGMIGGMYGEMLESRIMKPDDYNEKKVEKVLLEVEDNEQKNWGKPNIIVVFSESFWDINQLDEIEFNQKVTPNFNKLKDEGLFFNMITPSYGGISANVEYEFLTGSNTMYFNHSFIPYMQLYRNDTYYDRPSIIKELKNNGYRTKIVPCSSKYLFNCERFYNYLQVDETNYIGNVDEKYIKGKYVSDKYVTDKIIDEFEKKEKNEKLFYMTLTMQAHMPYQKNKYKDYDVWVTKSELSTETNDTLTSYAQGIYDADKQLGRLYEYINTLEEPTIIVFFGDHLPFLNTGKVNAIDELRYFNTSDKLLNNYRKYNTQSLIIANFELKSDEENTKFLGPDLLSSYILNNMDIEISNYYKWLYNSRKNIGSANFLVTVDSKGNLYNTDNLSGSNKKLYDLRRNIEYKLFVK